MSETCRKCSGTGESSEACSECHGMHLGLLCGTCDGQMYIKESCSVCSGSGQVEDEAHQSIFD